MTAPAHALFRNSCSKPISLTEFREALTACRPTIHSAPPTRPPSRVQAIALAVSGGVDSMAMAWLVSSTIYAYPGINIAGNPIYGAAGIVIDHGLRPNSAQEASRVALALRKLCITPHVKSIDLSSASPGPRSAIEGLARKMRFRKLGLTCLDLQVFSLLLAHHSDDQYETALMRLTLGHSYRGLQGITAANTIPECYDLYGIGKSGLFPSRPISRPLSRHRKILSPLKCELGGVTIYRPLLEFDKDRLMATCEANKVPWFQDETNFDQTLTLRNAIRHMVQNHKLPQALQKPAIDAMCRRVKAKVVHEDKEAERWLKHHRVIRHFDSNGGTLLVTFPPRRKRWGQRRRLFAKARLQKRRVIATIMIRKLIDFVTPVLQLKPLIDLHVAVDWLFPELRHGPPAEVSGFTISGVYFGNHGADTWLLTRRPFPNSLPLPETCLHTGDIARDKSVPWKQVKSREVSAPVLWDGRFWIKVQSQKPMHIRVLPLLPEHLETFRAPMPYGLRQLLKERLKKCAPGKVRFTLPGIYCSTKEEAKEQTGAEEQIEAKQQSEGDEETKVEEHTKAEQLVKTQRQTISTLRLLALPSLGIHTRHAESLISYKAMYKALDYVLLKSCEDQTEKPVSHHRRFISASKKIRDRRLAASRNK
ncbi:hypothetical protein CDD81_6254 [Ophiocordyceps australis]|uniref:tRNA(Ile)-lysidine synthetase n=1 Tax=Ophiocordyceps australis TaxID=1399860 RepID=A0A2C5Y652_9HYPO|nr:hypothetical protein CDD81_6254 [Ophiocordyceps australis]